MRIKVIGRKYSEVASYSFWDEEERFPNYEKVDEQTWEIEADTLRDGEKWLAENHPDMYMGGNVICENGDFAMLAVPCMEYGKGNFETIAKRISYVQNVCCKRWEKDEEEAFPAFPDDYEPEEEEYD